MRIYKTKIEKVKLAPYFVSLYRDSNNASEAFLEGLKLGLFGEDEEVEIEIRYNVVDISFESTPRWDIEDDFIYYNETNTGLSIKDVYGHKADEIYQLLLG